MSWRYRIAGDRIAVATSLLLKQEAAERRGDVHEAACLAGARGVVNLFPDVTVLVLASGHVDSGLGGSSQFSVENADVVGVPSQPAVPHAVTTAPDPEAKPADEGPAVADAPAKGAAETEVK